jgi:hypothetical protein
LIGYPHRLLPPSLLTHRHRWLSYATFFSTGGQPWSNSLAFA